jgi:tetratricopeptide (TPR) repeat protein
MNKRLRAVEQTRSRHRWAPAPTIKAKSTGFFFLLTCGLFLLLRTNDKAQFTSAGQAKSREEFDAYLLVLSKTSPKEVISAAGDFEQHWPHSELLGQVLELQLNAYLSLGDSAQAIVAGEKALKAVPDNLAILSNLAYIIANSTIDPQHLASAEEYARRELERSRTILVPKKISPEEWNEIQSRLGSTAHAALGLVSYKRGDIAGAIREFETAVKLAPAPDPAQYYRLGMLYRASGNQSKAAEMLHRVVESNDPTLRPLAERELKSLPP